MLIFEKSVKGRTGVLLDECDVPAVALNAPRRAQEARLPEVSEIDVIRHYTALSKKAHGVDAVIKENDHAMDDIRYFAYTIMSERHRGRVLSRKDLNI